MGQAFTDDIRMHHFIIILTQYMWMTTVQKWDFTETQLVSIE